MHHFICNICGTEGDSEHLDRERSSCATCGSNVRYRWIVHALSTGLFGQSLPLQEMPVRKDIRGIGLSDPQLLADAFSVPFAYENTFYHTEPRLDIMTAAGEAEYDFIVSSEVFEHVNSPVQTAFNNLARLLKPGGVAIFTVPWGFQPETIEHFPSLHDWQLVELRSGWVLLNRTADGQLETFEKLVFHGGPGSTLEMRLFSHAALMAHFRTAGFAEITMAEEVPAWGIVELPWSRGFLLRKAAA